MKEESFQKFWDSEWRAFSRSAYLRVNQGVVREISATLKGQIKGKKILEVGSGCGGDSVFLAKEGADCTTLDFSSEAIKLCQQVARKEGIRVKGIMTDCRRIPVKDNFFDLVFSVGLVEHFKDPLPVLKEQLRVLKKGGFLIIDVPQKYNLYTIAKHLRMRFGKHPFGWETEYSVRDFKKIAKILKLKAVRFYGRDSAFTIHLPLLIRSSWQKLFSLIESLPIAPSVCLNIGLIAQNRNDY